ncbi:Ankyrin repeat-containing domain [Fusarium albosuccineum]|uniref:Ankyrin repeat-containing domain n=1 Tax=Fusarium albosuccineum TaxID=1237068 RepID=A0A8H4LQG6_9HYPO|nr:Ankyrin repeat-containing domain [Fusarium albosuccineum]
MTPNVRHFLDSQSLCHQGRCQATKEGVGEGVAIWEAEQGIVPSRSFQDRGSQRCEQQTTAGMEQAGRILVRIELLTNPSVEASSPRLGKTRIKERHLAGGHLAVTAEDNQAVIEKFVLKQPSQRVGGTSALADSEEFQEKNQGTLQDPPVFMAIPKPGKMVIATTQDTDEEFYVDPNVDIDYILDACHDLVIAAGILSGRMQDWNEEDRQETKAEEAQVHRYTE